MPRQIILGIWGRETVYGTHKLPHHCIRVLATQAYLGRRKEFFRKELLWALKIVEDGDAKLSEMKSSWGGAMGLTQMLPTNFRDYAEDFDGDGRRNIWTSIPDSLASTARSLLGAKHIDGSDARWIPDQPWGYEVRKPAKPRLHARRRRQPPADRPVGRSSASRAPTTAASRRASSTTRRSC